jgi:hypothetical protein
MTLYKNLGSTWLCAGNAEKLMVISSIAKSAKIPFPLEINGAEFYFETNALGIIHMRRDFFLQSSIALDVKWPFFGLETMLNWLTERIRQPVFLMNGTKG